MRGCDRHAYARTAQQEYAGRAHQRHCARALSAFITASPRLPFQVAPKRFTGNPGYSLPRAQKIIVRSRLLLAWTQLSERKSISLQRRILAAKDFGKQETRFSNATAASQGRLESVDSLGMRNKGSPATRKETLSVHEAIS
jgi:hypothetical protein